MPFSPFGRGALTGHDCFPRRPARERLPTHDAPLRRRRAGVLTEDEEARLDVVTVVGTRETVLDGNWTDGLTPASTK
ncbi:hypothetical protein [Frankia tisae]|uniref:hypothetical protein n=1 Tax=Frankia tisae TaxID=2950104 RepID=UPI0021BF42C6|nr:hypothetical protein [Frankia tisae]